MRDPARRERTVGLRLTVPGLTLVGLAAAVAHAWPGGAEAAGIAGWRGVVPLAVFLTAFAAAIGVGVAARPRPFSPLDRRRLLGSAGIWLWIVGVFVPDRLTLAKLAPLSVACTVWAAWAWLGPRVEPRSPAATRWFQLLAALLALLAAAPWLAWAWLAWA